MASGPGSDSYWEGSNLTVLGGIVAMAGVGFLYQNATGHYESWAYTWALVGPGGSGLGILLYGMRTRDRTTTREGFWISLIALGLFAVGLALFEGVLGISGEHLVLPSWVLPGAVIVLGVLVLGRGLTSPARRAGPSNPTAET